MYTCVCTYILDARAKSMPGKSWVKAKAIGVGAAGSQTVRDGDAGGQAAAMGAMTTQIVGVDAAAVHSAG